MGFLDGLLTLGALGYMASDLKKTKEKNEQEYQKFLKEMEAEDRRMEREAKKKAKEYEKQRLLEEERKNTPYNYDEGISEADFLNIAKETAKRIKRIRKVTVEGLKVKAIFESQSGCSDWEINVDFNDWGHLTGKYWLSSDNYDSLIPTRFADLMAEEITERVSYDKME